MIIHNFKIIRDNFNVNHWSLSFYSHTFTKLHYKHGDKLIIDVRKPQSPGTEEQNRAMHALLTEYYKTGMHNCPLPCTLDDFKIHIKSQYGPQIIKKIAGREVLIIKSWANYTKSERMSLIDGLISEIHQSGAYAESQKIREIIEGMSLSK